MVRRTMMTAVVGGALALGGAGVAVAAAAPAGATTTPAHSPNCAKAPKALARLTRAENKISTALSKSEARQAKAEQAGHTALAQVIGARITWLHAAASYDTTLQQKINAACPSGANTSTT